MPNTTSQANMKSAHGDLYKQLIAQYDYLTDAPDILHKLLNDTGVCLHCVRTGNYVLAKELIGAAKADIVCIHAHDEKWHVFKDDALNNNWYSNFLASILERISNCVGPLEAEIDAHLALATQAVATEPPARRSSSPKNNNF